MSAPSIDLVLSRLDGVKKNGTGWMARCPAHDDHTPSLRVWEDNEGRVAFRCFADCDHDRVREALGLPKPQQDDDYPSTYRPKDSPESLPIVAKYRYTDEHGTWLYTVGRTPNKQFPVWRPDPADPSRIVWGLAKVRRVPYRLPQVISTSQAGGTVYICEGEKDVESVERAGAVATCNPHGAGKWRDEYSQALAHAHVVIVRDKDEPGHEHAAAVAASVEHLAASVRVVEAAEGKDAADHFAAGHGLDDFVTVKAASVSLPSDTTATVQPESVPVEPPGIATSPDILADFACVLHGRGVAGEDRFAKVTYLCLTSRVLKRPVSLAAKGPSSAGKSFVVQEVVSFFPESAYHALSAMSEHSLAYGDEPLSHRFLILYEAAGLEGDFASYLMRSLLSEGCIRYETVEKVKGAGLQPRLIVREGPTGLIVTTTQVSLHPENETRLLSVPANDTPQQTAAIIRMLACEDGRTNDDNLAEWLALQSWIDAQDNRVTIPFAVDLGALVPPVAVRLRRDFATVLNLVRAHAVLHQQTRERDPDGRIVATVADYGAVRELVADLVADEVGATVPATVVETVSAVVELHAKHEGGITYLQLGDRLSLDKSAAMRRAKIATSRGYVRNLETRRGQPAKLVPGEPLPGEVTILPTVETLTGCTVARSPEGERPDAEEALA